LSFNSGFKNIYRGYLEPPLFNSILLSNYPHDGSLATVFRLLDNDTMYDVMTALSGGLNSIKDAFVPIGIFLNTALRKLILRWRLRGSSASI
jgi:hypothetical protein